MLFRVLRRCAMAGYCMAWLLWWGRTPVGWVGLVFVIPMIDFMRLSIVAAQAWVYSQVGE